jgi:hypothetical protein
MITSGFAHHSLINECYYLLHGYYVLESAVAACPSVSGVELRVVDLDTTPSTQTFLQFQ